jgi:hypothetical protein
MALMQFLRLRRGVSEVVHTSTLTGTLPLFWRREQGLSGGDVGRREPTVCVQLTSGRTLMN